MKNTANWILAIMGSFICLFVVAMCVIFCFKDSVPDTLIQYTLGAGGVECLLLAAIKVSKVVTNKEDLKDDESEDEENGP